MPESYKIQPVNDRVPQIVDSAIYGDIRFDPDDQIPIYIGSHLTSGTSTGAQNWKILKFTYSGTAGSSTRIQLAYGSWDGRAALFS